MSRAEAFASGSPIPEAPLTARLMAGKPQVEKKKRRRKAVSCQNCRIRKIKCSHEYPCSSCKCRGDTCDWGDAVPMKKPEASPHDLANEIGRLNFVIRAMGTRLALDQKEIDRILAQSVALVTAALGPSDTQVFQRLSYSEPQPFKEEQNLDAFGINPFSFEHQHGFHPDPTLLSTSSSPTSSRSSPPLDTSSLGHPSFPSVPKGTPIDFQHLLPFFGVQQDFPLPFDPTTSLPPLPFLRPRMDISSV